MAGWLGTIVGCYQNEIEKDRSGRTREDIVPEHVSSCSFALDERSLTRNNGLGYVKMDGVRVCPIIV